MKQQSWVHEQCYESTVLIIMKEQLESMDKVLTPPLIGNRSHISDGSSQSGPRGCRTPSSAPQLATPLSGPPWMAASR